MLSFSKMIAFTLVLNALVASGKLIRLKGATFEASATMSEEVNVYSYRQPFLVEPMFDEFTKETGIKVNVKFAKNGLAEKLQQEGEYSPADVILTNDISRLTELTDKNLVQKVDSEVLETNIPANYEDNDNEWFALTLRTRNVFSSRDRVGKLGNGFNYIDLANSEYKGKICTRSFKHRYNVSLVASMIVHHGEAKTKVWLEGVKANLAYKPTGNDRTNIKAIKEGRCDITLCNGYDLGKMMNDVTQKPWADAVYINFPNQDTSGTHVNVSGMAMAKFAPNKGNALKLMEFLASDEAQSMYAEVTYEYPVKKGVKPSALVESWGNFKADTVSLDEVAYHHEMAIKLVDEVRFDL